MLTLVLGMGANAQEFNFNCNMHAPVIESIERFDSGTEYVFGESNVAKFKLVATDQDGDDLSVSYINILGSEITVNQAYVANEDGGVSLPNPDAWYTDYLLNIKGSQDLVFYVTDGLHTVSQTLTINVVDPAADGADCEDVISYDYLVGKSSNVTNVVDCTYGEVSVFTLGGQAIGGYNFHWWAPVGFSSWTFVYTGSEANAQAAYDYINSLVDGDDYYGYEYLWPSAVSSGTTASNTPAVISDASIGGSLGDVQGEGGSDDNPEGYTGPSYGAGWLKFDVTVSDSYVATGNVRIKSTFSWANGETEVWYYQGSNPGEAIQHSEGVQLESVTLVVVDYSSTVTTETSPCSGDSKEIRNGQSGGPTGGAWWQCSHVSEIPISAEVTLTL